MRPQGATHWQGRSLNEPVNCIPPASEIDGHLLRCRWQAINAIGESVWSKSAQYSTQASVPEQPSAPASVSASIDSITMRWEAPHDSGDPISQYRLERDDGEGGDFELAYTGPDCSALLGGLQCGAPYRFRLWAFNSVRS